MNTFGSDNFSAADPRIMDFLVEINGKGHFPSYDGDEITEQARAEFRKVFGDDILVLFVPTGTGANMLGLRLLMERSYQALITSDVSHIYADESGAPSMQIFPLANTHGRIALADIEDDVALRRAVDYHSAEPKVISIANATEVGTIYQPDDVEAIAKFCHDNNMYLHLDGSRLANMAAALGTGLREVSRDLGADVLSFGGAKNGLMIGEAVVIFNAPKASLLRLQKQGGQLVSKMRYISGQFIPYLRDGLWLENAMRANDLAAKFTKELQKAAPEIQLTHPLETNQIFCRMPDGIKKRLLKSGEIFYDWDPGEVRLVTAWDNTEDDIERFIKVVKAG